MLEDTEHLLYGATLQSPIGTHKPLPKAALQEAMESGSRCNL